MNNNNVKTKVIRKRTMKIKSTKVLKKTARFLFKAISNVSSFCFNSVIEFIKLSHKEKAIIIVGMIAAICTILVLGTVLNSALKAMWRDFIGIGQFFLAATLYILDYLLGWLIRPVLTLIFSIINAFVVFFNQISQLF